MESEVLKGLHFESHSIVLPGGKKETNSESAEFVNNSIIGIAFISRLAPKKLLNHDLLQTANKTAVDFVYSGDVV